MPMEAAAYHAMNTARYNQPNESSTSTEELSKPSLFIANESKKYSNRCEAIKAIFDNKPAFIRDSFITDLEHIIKNPESIYNKNPDIPNLSKYFGYMINPTNVPPQNLNDHKDFSLEIYENILTKRALPHYYDEQKNIYESLTNYHKALSSVYKILEKFHKNSAEIKIFDPLKIDSEYLEPIFKTSTKILGLNEFEHKLLFIASLWIFSSQEKNTIKKLDNLLHKIFSPYIDINQPKCNIL